MAVIEPLGQSGIFHCAFNLCQGLSTQDVEVTLVTARGRAELGSRRTAFAVVEILGGMERKASRFFRLLSYLCSLPALLRFLMAGRFDIVHWQGSLVPFLDAPFLSLLKAAGLLVVVTVHDPDQDAIDGPRERWGLRRLALGHMYRIADRLIALSQAGRRELIAAFSVRQDRVLLVHLGNLFLYAEGPVLGRGECRAALGVPASAPVVLFFGQVKRTKGLEYLIRAFANVRRTSPDALLLVAGEPRPHVDMNAYRRQACTLGIADAVRFDLEYIPESRVPLYFVAADVVALPYTRVYQSAVLQVAYAFGRPVVATTVGAFTEAVQEGETGLLVPPADHQALAQAVVQLLSDPAMAARMGRNGRQLAETQYSWETVARSTAELYSLLVQEREAHKVRASAR